LTCSAVARFARTASFLLLDNLRFPDLQLVCDQLALG